MVVIRHVPGIACAIGTAVGSTTGTVSAFGGLTFSPEEEKVVKGSQRYRTWQDQCKRKYRVPREQEGGALPPGQAHQGAPPRPRPQR